MIREFAMNRRPIEAHKMFEEFSVLPKLMYFGEYDKDCNLINVYSPLQEKLIRIFGTYQWILPSTNEVFFIDEDTNFNKNEEII